MLKQLGVAVSIVLGLSACGADGQTSDAKACAAPVIATVGTAAVGETVTVVGENFLDGCNDNIVVDANGVEIGNRPDVKPINGITLSFAQGDTDAELARVDADENGSFSVEVAIPASAHSGTAALWAVDPTGRSPETTTDLNVTK